MHGMIQRRSSTLANKLTGEGLGAKGYLGKVLLKYVLSQAYCASDALVYV